MKNVSANMVHSNKQLKIAKGAIIADSISAMLIFLFLYTALSKLLDYEHFKSVLIMSPLLGPFAPIIGWLLPAVEITIAVLLFFSRTRKRGLFATVMIMLLFTGYITYMVFFTPRLSCSCGGVLKNLTWVQHIFFNLLILLLTAIAILLYRKIKQQIIMVPP